jgi:uncharacterized protein (DUF2062 family)
MRTDNLIVMVSKSSNSIRLKAALWLRQGISPRRLALTLALGFAIGCLPVLGITSLLCTALALALRLNLPAIQAANYLVMPLQVLLIVPFVRLGSWLFTFGPRQSLSSITLLHTSPQALVSQLVSMAGLAVLAWLVTAIPAIALMTFTLTPLLRRVPALAAARTNDSKTA